MITPNYEAESLDEFEAATPEYGEIESTEAATEDAVFGETEEMELAAELLEIRDENELQGFVSNLISRATGGMLDVAAWPHLRGLLRQAAKRVLPMVGGSAGRRLATAAGDLFGLELEGLSPEDQDFEVARRYVRFAGAGASNAARFRPGVSPSVAARRALGAAARRHAPGFLRQRQPGRSGGALGQAPGFPRSRMPGPLGDALGGPASTDDALAPPPWRQAPGFPRWRQPGQSMDVFAGPAWTRYAPATPIPIEVTCHCCGAQQSVTVPGTTGDADRSTLPTNEPATSIEPPQQQTLDPEPPQQQQTQEMEGTNMHDFDRITMETSDEADFEFSGAQDESATESPFSEEQEVSHAVDLIGINNQAELDHFVSDIISSAANAVKNAVTARGFGGADINSPCLQSLGGVIGSAIKKGLQIARAKGGGIQLPHLTSEVEALSPEDQQFEDAKRMVRMVGAAVQNAAQAPPTADPEAAAKSALVAAAQAHAPDLLQPVLQGPGSSHHHHHHPHTGKWYRRGRKILLVGV
jgi:hypothetical protein